MKSLIKTTQNLEGDTSSFPVLIEMFIFFFQPDGVLFNARNNERSAFMHHMMEPGFRPAINPERPPKSGYNHYT